MTVETVRSCPACGSTKTRRPNGRLICGPCDNRRSVEWASKNRERRREISRKSAEAHRATNAEWRKANAETIREKKRVAYFADREAIRRRQAAYYATTRADRQATSQAWNQANRERVRAYQAAWYVSRRAELTARARAYYAENRESIRAFLRANPDIGRTGNQRRRARTLAAICEHGPKCVTRDFLAALRVGCCLYCDNPAEHADHFIPLARGGLHCVENLVPACAPCNRSKRASDPEEWLQRIEGVCAA